MEGTISETLRIARMRPPFQLFFFRTSLLSFVFCGSCTIFSCFFFYSLLSCLFFLCRFAFRNSVRFIPFPFFRGTALAAVSSSIFLPVRRFAASFLGLPTDSGCRERLCRYACMFHCLLLYLVGTECWEKRGVP